ncbi:hypothetical protein [Thalassobacillus sp. CUG 92003]|uniref:hypothetical protein n=1 Tax=Thalassobacillus sp. CUG 92003 TaxID=2736641 RepID=UPI0015E73571|nr:hypothetical protein [Thalassobacillus sp. CUG 92003]
MATKTELSQRLLTRFKDVPNVDSSDVDEWILTAMNEHGYAANENVLTDDITLILLYAEADGAGQIALRTAYYFSFSDGNEQVDKSMISEQYRKLANTLQTKYAQKKSERSGSSFKIMKRADRR